LTDAIETVKAALQGLPATLNADSLRGVEGAAARAHFAGLAAVVAPGMGFSGRNRRPPRDPVNVCLSLAYTLLHVEAVRACHAAGLDPLLGFFHRPAFGRESMASDLIEPLRAVADHWVWEQLRERHLREDHFSLDKGACVLGKAGRACFYSNWQQLAKPLSRWLRKVVAELVRELRQDGVRMMECETAPFGEDAE
jgi:CRISPR-associated protein Cas1